MEDLWRGPHAAIHKVTNATPAAHNKVYKLRAGGPMTSDSQEQDRKASDPQTLSAEHLPSRTKVSHAYTQLHGDVSTIPGLYQESISSNLGILYEQDNVEYVIS